MHTSGCYRSLLQLTTGLTLGACLSGAAMAADIAPMPTKAPISPAPVLSPWTYSATLYGWVPLLNGSTTVKGRTTDVDVGYSQLGDLIRHSEIPKDLLELAGYFEARNGRFSIFSDLVYLKVGLNGSMTRSRGVDALNASIGVSAGLKFEMFIAELAAAYEVARWGATSTPGSGTAIDVFAGARGWWQHADLDINAVGTVNIFDLTFSRAGVLTATKSVGWFDPLVGIRLRHQFAPGVNFVASGDVGGFGVGSKFSWQALAALNYDFCVRNNVTWSGMVGYKALFVDYSQGSGVNHYEYDMTMHGPIIGITARF
ncbi:MAG TPA: hypothetical protein VEJ43_11245 [Pseudolabrys sp.]|nr:hypothetical protein [Pseudolabrys sp.]